MGLIENQARRAPHVTTVSCMPELTELAFGEFYRRHARALWSYVYRVTGNAADADEIVQDAFCRVFCAEVSDLSDEEAGDISSASPAT